MMTLTQAETGEGWNMLMHDTILYTNYGASFYWTSFVLIKSNILLQIIIAVIFEKLE